MNELEVYKTMPEWSAETLPDGFRKKHNTKAGTWARLTVLEGALRFMFLTEDGAVLTTVVIEPESGPQLIEPEVWHRVEPVDATMRCQLEFLRKRAEN